MSAHRIILDCDPGQDDAGADGIAVPAATDAAATPTSKLRA